MVSFDDPPYFINLSIKSDSKAYSLLLDRLNISSILLLNSSLDTYPCNKSLNCESDKTPSTMELFINPLTSSSLKYPSLSDVILYLPFSVNKSPSIRITEDVDVAKHVGLIA